MKKTLLLLTLSGALLFSCKKEYGAESAPTPAAGSSSAKKATEALGEDFKDLAESPAFASMEKLSSFFSGVGDLSLPSFRKGQEKADKDKLARQTLRKLESFKKVVRSIENSSGRIAAEDEAFDFKASTGKWKYDAGKSEWEQTSKGGNEIVMIFQSKDGGAYDGKFTISNYREEKVSVTMKNENNKKTTEMVYLPTGLDANLTISGKEYMKLNFSASYSSKSLIMVESLLYSLYLKPFTMTFNINSTSNTIGTGMNISKEGDSDAIMAYSITAKFKTSGEEPEVDEFNGFIAFRDKMRIEGQATRLASASSSAKFEDHAKVELYIDGRKEGKIISSKDGEGLVIKYNNGSTEEISELFSSIGEEEEETTTEVEDTFNF